MKTVKTLFLHLILLIFSTQLAAQNVGIGTVAPMEKLHVVGNVKVSTLQGTGNRLVYTNNNGVLSFLPTPTPGFMLVADAAGSPSWTNATASGAAWNLQGNDNTNDATDFLGTTDNEDLVFKTDNQEILRINSNGRVEMGGPSNFNGAKFDIDLLGNPGASMGQRIRMEQGNNGFYGIYKEFQTKASDTRSAIGEQNNFSGNGTNSLLGVVNLFFRKQGDQIGMSNFFNHTGQFTVITNPMPRPAYIRGVQNIVQDTVTTNIIYGLYNEFRDIHGLAYGAYHNLEPEPSSLQDVYGSYTSITNNAGARYGSYYDVPGQTDNSFATVFNQGSVVANESGGNYDFRIESNSRSHAFWLDADQDLAVLGTDTPDLSGNGANIAGTTVNFAADFDKGTTSGTAIGIGSREFLLDGATETNINNGFAPLVHLTYDLGYSTTDRAWDDVYADAYVTVSDKREKHDIHNLSYGLSEILKMRPVSYKLNRDPNGETKLGLIAQEVLPIVKEAVKTHDYKMANEATEKFEEVELERMGMTYQDLIPVLIKATQEQQAQVEELKALTKQQAEALQTQQEELNQLRKIIQTQIEK